LPDDEDTSPFEQLLADAIATHEAGGDAALQEFLERHPDQRDRLFRPLKRLLQMDLLADSPQLRAPLIEDFELGEELGAGGMGVVYAAQQRSLHRPVALKLVRPEHVLLAGARERFRREVEAVASLEHPAIVQILSSGDADGLPYYVMPRLTGRNGEQVVRALRPRSGEPLTGADLRQLLLADGQAPDNSDSDAEATFSGTYWQAVTRLVRKAALGIQHAHARGVLHRDLKPSNVMFSAGGSAVVLDFGLARRTGQEQLTRTGATPGSPLYMAPEQVRGQVADERTDVYGLAVTLYTLIALQPPFDPEDATELGRLIVDDYVPDLSSVAQVPTDLSIVVGCGMERDRDRRYASAQDFAADLLAVLEQRPIAARRLPIRVRAQRFLGRNRALSTGLAVAALFLILLPVLLLAQSNAANTRLQAEVERADEGNKAMLSTFWRLLRGPSADALSDLPRARLPLAQMLSVPDETLAELAQADDDFGHIAQRLRVYLISDRMELARQSGQPRQLSAAAEQMVAATQGRADDDLRFYRAEALAALAELASRAGEADEAREHIARVDALLNALAKTKDDDYRWMLEPDALTIEGEGLALRLRRLGALHVANQARVHELDDALDAADDRFALAARLLPAALVADASADDCHELERVKFLRRAQRFEAADAAAQALIGSLEAAPAAEEVAAWPTAAFLRAEALAQRSRIAQQSGAEDRSPALLRAAVSAYTAALRVHPESGAVHEGRGLAALNLAVYSSRRRDWPATAAAARSALTDLITATRLDDAPTATARAKAAYLLGSVEGDVATRLLAARHVAAAGEPKRVALAIQWLQQIVAAGHEVDLAAPDFDPLRGDPAFRALTDN